ncbi:MAG: helix-turn-helix transcriptional regulator [Candidatus Brockarchaeota archaeon]|nr:helix-turn-helix transcriptional regulator [Candidatus Brockarchaeota archaeon]
MSPPLELMDALSNPTRLKVLCALASLGPSTKYRICRETGAAQRSVNQQLELLVGMGLVRKLKYEAVVLYELEENNPLAAELKPVLGWIWTRRSARL